MHGRIISPVIMNALHRILIFHVPGWKKNTFETLAALGKLDRIIAFMIQGLPLNLPQYDSAVMVGGGSRKGGESELGPS